MFHPDLQCNTGNWPTLCWCEFREISGPRRVCDPEGEAKAQGGQYVYASGVVVK